MRWLPFSSSNSNRHRSNDEHNRLFGKISRPLIGPRDQDTIKKSTITCTSKSFGNDIDDDSIEALSTLRSFNEANKPTDRERERLRSWSRSRSRPRPQPLPLPKFERRRKECSCSGIPSPDDGFDRCSASPSPPVNRAYAHQETRTFAHHGNANPSNIVRQDHNGIGGSQDSCTVGVPVRSAPTSPYSSPARSPTSLYYSVEPRGKQVWSAPEMPFDDKVLKISNLSHLDHISYNCDCSPLHSPAARSPPTNSPSTATSPVHPNNSSEALLLRHENINHVNVHPLPLPPGATSSTASPATSQAVTRVNSLSMIRQWQKGKLIGRGTFGSVYVATNRKTGALCAMKEVEMFPDDPKSAECIKQLQQEIKVLSQLKHPNIVQYYGSEITDDRFYIYLEYVHPGSINRYVRENCGAMTESVVRCFTRHILRGLAYLHSKKTIHRDIKGANLLVDSCGVVKLADFGMAKHLTGQRADLSLKGSPYWMAPELMQAVMQKDNSSELALAVDIWSLGCTIIEMLTGKPPWSEYEGAAAMFKVMRDNPPIPSTLSPEGKDFLQLCFCRNPAARPSAAKLLDHQFLRG